MLGLLAALTISTAPQGLRPLFPDCTGAGCGDFAKPVWKMVKADTGEVTALDTASVQPMSGGGALAFIYTYLPRELFDPSHGRQIIFTCRGRFQDLGIPGDFEDAPPRSVMGVVAATACAIAHPAR
jgi:hypothetical protein